MKGKHGIYYINRESKYKMIHRMKLNDDPYTKIAEREKTIELRLFDEKRKMININDYIVFQNCLDCTKELSTKVTALYRYSTFAELFKEFSIDQCGFSKELEVEDAVKKMYDYYSENDICKYGVLGIRLELLADPAILILEQ